MPGDKIEISQVSDEYKKNYDRIKWSGKVEIDKEKVKRTKKHATAGLCGEYGMSTFDEEKYKENYDRINWGKSEPAEI